jgi:hypothetical protein
MKYMKSLHSAIIKTVILLMIYYLFSGCQTHRLVKPRAGDAAVDSSLYFEQVKIEDPFYYAILEHKTQKITLEKVLIPEPVDSTKERIQRFKEIEGYRVQVFAGVDSINALDVSYQCKSLMSDSVYFFYEKGLYKIQVGDYQFYPRADSVKTIYRKNGYPGAWIVRRKILIPVKKIEDRTFEEEETISDAQQLLVTGTYNIQILATLSEEKARLIVASIKRSGKYKSYYNKKDNMYKVYVGPFKNENEARSALQDMQSSGYPDAWLVY